MRGVLEAKGLGSGLKQRLRLERKRAGHRDTPSPPRAPLFLKPHTYKHNGKRLRRRRRRLQAAVGRAALAREADVAGQAGPHCRRRPGGLRAGAAQAGRPRRQRRGHSRRSVFSVIAARAAAAASWSAAAASMRPPQPTRAKTNIYYATPYVPPKQTTTAVWHQLPRQRRQGVRRGGVRAAGARGARGADGCVRGSVPSFARGGRLLSLLTRVPSCGAPAHARRQHTQRASTHK